MDYWRQLTRIFETYISDQSICEMREGHAYSWIRLGNIFQRDGRYTEAIEAYKKVVELYPGNAYYWNEFGNVYYNARFFNEALQAYFMAIQLDAKLGWAYTNVALVIIRQGNQREAEMLFNKGINLLWQNKDKARAWNNMGNLYRELNDYYKAFAAFKMADEYYPMAGWGSCKRHQLYNDFGLIEGAIAVVDDEIYLEKLEAWLLATQPRRNSDNDPVGAKLWNELGNIHYLQKAYDDAIRAYNKAIKLDAGFGWAYNNLAMVLSKKGEFVKAIPLARKSLYLIGDCPQIPFVWNGLGNYYRAIGDYLNATLAYQRADELINDHNKFVLHSIPLKKCTNH